jgi:hypothetical protein
MGGEAKLLIHEMERETDLREVATVRDKANVGEKKGRRDDALVVKDGEKRGGPWVGGSFLGGGGMEGI